MVHTFPHPTLGDDPRLIPLEASFNLRDFGGYETAGGQRVKLRTLYRSGTMAMLTNDDEARLRELGICGICDFRRQNERMAEPTMWHLPAGIAYWSRDYAEFSGVLGEVLKDQAMSAGDMRAAMISLYRKIPHDHALSYAAMFRQIAEGSVPLLINCSAGKDRTGIGAALILTVLGVSREDIEHDYLATNTHADWPMLLTRRDDTLVARAWRRDPETIAPLLRAEGEYLEAAFDELETEWGGAEGYLATIGIDAVTLARVRDELLVT